MEKYICRVCGEIYNPKFGDPDHGVEPDTNFSEVPADWSCPTCKANKGEFEVYGDE
jgi:rubredoxin